MTYPIHDHDLWVGLRTIQSLSTPACLVFDLKHRRTLALGIPTEGRSAEQVALQQVSWWTKHFGHLLLLGTHGPSDYSAVVQCWGIREIRFLHPGADPTVVHRLARRGLSIKRLFTPHASR